MWFPCSCCLCLVYFLQSLGELSPYADPFAGFEVVVLEEEHERVGAQEGGVLAEELGLAELGALEGWWLFSWVEGDWGGDGDRVCV